MRTCSSCGRENPDTNDFCECGEYLRWEQTTVSPIVSRSPPVGGAPPAPSSGTRNPPPPPPSAPPSEPSPHGADKLARQPSVLATLVVRLSDGETDGSGPVTVSAEAGGRATVLALLRNASAIVDNYEVSIRGLPDGWWSISPRVAYLVPYGSSGAYEQELEAVLHPPRTPEAFARPWPFEVVAVSRAYSTTAASASATLIVTPYIEISSEVRPERVTGRWKGRYQLNVRNTSNAEAEVRVRGEDTDGSCQFKFPRQALTVRPGEAASLAFAVRPPRQIWVGKPVERQLSLFASPVGVAKEPSPCRATFRQRSWLPKWLAVLLVVLLLIAAGAVAAKLISNSSSSSGSSDTSPATTQAVLTGGWDSTVSAGS
jgi:hypothetical protein